jgi:hypothetical protein
MLRGHMRGGERLGSGANGPLDGIPDGMTLCERQGLRFRSQIYFVFGATAFIAQCQFFMLLWWLTQPASACFGAFVLTDAPGCAGVDGTAVAAIVLGLLAVLRVHAFVRAFMHAPLVLLPGEQVQSCYTQNASSIHVAWSGKGAKIAGGIALGAEVLVASAGFDPMWYCLVAMPGECECVAVQLQPLPSPPPSLPPPLPLTATGCHPPLQASWPR